MSDLLARLEELEWEIKKLRRRVRKEEDTSSLTLLNPIQVQSLNGDTKDVFFGYEGPVYKDVASDFDGLSTATDPYTRISSTVNNTTRYALLQLTAAEPDGAVTQEYARINIIRDSSGNNSVQIIASDSGATSTTTFFPTNIAPNVPFALLATGSDPSSPADGWLLYRTDTDRARLRANGAWVNLATTDDLSGYTQVYYKNIANGSGPAATTSETSLGSFTVTGGDMGTDGVIRMHMQGTFAGAGASTTVTVRIKFGGSTLATLTSAAYASSAIPWVLDFWMGNSGGSASTQRSGGHILVGAQNFTTDEVVGWTAIYDGSSIDTSSDRTFEVTAQLSDGTSGNAFYRNVMVAELL